MEPVERLLVDIPEEFIGVVMEKLGMRREAHFRKDVMEKGEWRDSYLYAILREEWSVTSGSDGREPH